ncbi:hypothetical protein BMYO_1093 [Bifidobacterium myosotis]|uniref:Uncharacterized protein n=1 Tax=Bifidobacterium myosotis TaxID=1630166 RepID=A0A261FL25_9BIFI|nr:hypothetical protein BMYO_1093 [Bifidobacterium myosotis]
MAGAAATTLPFFPSEGRQLILDRLKFPPLVPFPREGGNLHSLLGTRHGVPPELEIR